LYYCFIGRFFIVGTAVVVCKKKERKMQKKWKQWTVDILLNKITSHKLVLPFLSLNRIA